MLWHCWLGISKSIRPVKIGWCGVGVVIFLERGADCLHMVQLMLLHPQTPSSLALFKSRLVLPFWYRLVHVVLEKRPLNGCSSSSVVLCRSISAVGHRLSMITDSQRSLRVISKWFLSLFSFLQFLHRLCLHFFTDPNYGLTFTTVSLQCFDAVGWAAGRASAL